jgi:hypothetical protein
MFLPAITFFLQKNIIEKSKNSSHKNCHTQQIPTIFSTSLLYNVDKGGEKM